MIDKQELFNSNEGREDGNGEGSIIQDPQVDQEMIDKQEFFNSNEGREDYYIEGSNTQDPQVDEGSEVNFSTEPSPNEEGIRRESQQIGLPEAFEVPTMATEVIIDGTVVVPRIKPKKRRALEKLLGLVTFAFALFVICFMVLQEVNLPSRLKINSSIQPSLMPSMRNSNAPSSDLSTYIKQILIPISGKEILEDETSVQNYCYRKILLDFPIHVTDEPIEEIEKEVHQITRRYVFFVVGLSSMLKAFRDFEQDVMIQKMLPYNCNANKCNDKGEVEIYVLVNRWSTPVGGGTIAKEVGEFEALTHLVLSRNAFTGTIPTEIGKLKNLHTLDLQFNYLTGTIPSEIGQLKNLKWLYLHGNSLTGTIPSTIGNITNLMYGDLSRNLLTGGIPSEIKQLENLNGLALNGNDISENLDALCYKDFSSEAINYTVDLGLSHVVDRTYNYLANWGIEIDCDNPAVASNCPCCICHR